jgi:hypothetical protein
MENAIKIIAKCIVDNNLTEAQIVKELEFLVQLAHKKQSTNFVDQLDRYFQPKKTKDGMRKLIEFTNREKEKSKNN